MSLKVLRTYFNQASKPIEYACLVLGSHCNHFNMNRAKLFKLLVILISLTMFVFQMNISLENLFNPPIIVSEKRLQLSEIKPPMITICPLNQVDETKLKRYGFLDYHEFLMGNNMNPFNPTNFWKVFEQILTYDPSHLLLEVQHEYKLMYNMTHFVRRFYPKFGYCWELADYVIREELRIYCYGTLNNTCILFLTDKFQRTKPALDLSSHRGTAIKVDESEDYTYFVEIVIKSFTKPLKPNYCKNYIENEFESCVDEAFKTLPLIDYVCQPPWLTSHNACKDMNWKNQTTAIEDIFLHFIPESVLNSIIEMRNFDEKKKCPKPCTDLRSQIRPGIAQISKGIGGTMLIFDEIAIFTEDIIVYDFSNFLVDLGSSVGLWFGLSVVGLTDLIMDAFSLTKTAFMRLKSK